MPSSKLVAERNGRIVGHILFSRLWVEHAGVRFAAVALAPLAVDPAFQKTGVGSALVEAAHRALRAAGETLSVVVGDPAYYGRFGYEHQRADLFESDYQVRGIAGAWPGPTRRHEGGWSTPRHSERFEGHAPLSPRHRI